KPLSFSWEALAGARRARLVAARPHQRADPFERRDRHDQRRRDFARRDALADLALAPPPAADLAGRLGLDALTLAELLAALGVAV
ncbi:MAG: hypothetical protein AAB368_15375, partial [bacterium]